MRGLFVDKRAALTFFEVVRCRAEWTCGVASLHNCASGEIRAIGRNFCSFLRFISTPAFKERKDQSTRVIKSMYRLHAYSVKGL
jgi:hypothetical protein